ncbi:MAG: citrate synthase, partial [Clostridia bacterium]|nr:citrate synthase [Clostridia bacterium]
MAYYGNQFQNERSPALNERLKFYCEECRKKISVDFEAAKGRDIKYGLRNPDGTGVLVGVTQISDVHGYNMVDGVKTPDEGRLFYRGIDVSKIIESCSAENRFGFEEVAFLLLFGYLPSARQLESFSGVMEEVRELPFGFVEDQIIKAPSPDI